MPGDPLAAIVAPLPRLSSPVSVRLMTPPPALPDASWLPYLPLPPPLPLVAGRRRSPYTAPTSIERLQEMVWCSGSSCSTRPAADLRWHCP